MIYEKTSQGQAIVINASSHSMRKKFGKSLYDRRHTICKILSRTLKTSLVSCNEGCRC